MTRLFVICWGLSRPWATPSPVFQFYPGISIQIKAEHTDKLQSRSAGVVLQTNYDLCEMKQKYFNKISTASELQGFRYSR